MRKLLAVLLSAGLVVAIGLIVTMTAGAKDHKANHVVNIPESDRFIPFGDVIHAGDSVTWVNNDEDDHTVVSDDAFNTAGNQGVNDLIPADGGTVTLKFNHPGQFVYYCRFHAKLDEFNQPVAPGPEGGIQDASGNFGTPMSGVITVLPKHGDG